ncbi:Metal-dependent phosphohydrolase [Massilia sp. LC238]|nr:Metal-dependent phosphohydrolase [Massilia sp. LC238]
MFFSTKNQTYIKPQTLDLSKPLGFGGGDKILRHESAEKWNVNPLQFMNIA